MNEKNTKLDRDFYDVLGVSRTFSDFKVLRRAYKREILKWHPDKSDRPDAVERFRYIREAFETLKDPARKEIYDKKFKLHTKPRVATSDFFDRFSGSKDTCESGASNRRRGNEGKGSVPSKTAFNKNATTANRKRKKRREEAERLKKKKSLREKERRERLEVEKLTRLYSHKVDNERPRTVKVCWSREQERPTMMELRQRMMAYGSIERITEKRLFVLVVYSSEVSAQRAIWSRKYSVTPLLV